MYPCASGVVAATTAAVVVVVVVVPGVISVVEYLKVLRQEAQEN